jgi:hypothetical protein
MKHHKEFRAYYERKVKEGKHQILCSMLSEVRSSSRAVAVINNQHKYVDNYKKAGKINQEKNNKKHLGKS